VFARDAHARALSPPEWHPVPLTPTSGNGKLKTVAHTYRSADDLLSGRAHSVDEIARRERVTARYVWRLIWAGFLTRSTPGLWDSSLGEGQWGIREHGVEKQIVVGRAVGNPSG
jgi:hypothetical protein